MASSHPVNLWILLGLGLAGILLLTKRFKKAIKKDFGAFIEKLQLPPPPQLAPPKARHPLTDLSFAVFDVGHRFKLYIPKETCSIAFSLSGVRCPGRDEPYSDEAISLMRRNIMQRDVEIEVETVDRNGTFLGSLWESKSNVAVTLVEAGLARLQTSFGSDKIPDIHLLEQAEKSAKQKKLKIWENYVEGEEVTNGPTAVEGKQKEVLKVVVTEVLGGGKFYVQTVGDKSVAAIQQQLASLSISEVAPVIGAFNPKKGDLVLAQFSADDSWNRAMVCGSCKWFLDRVLYK